MNPFKTGFRPFPSEIYRIPFPDNYHNVTLDDTKQAFATLFGSEIESNQIAAMFFEPVQGEGGYNVAEPEFVKYIRGLCDEHGIVMVADEIQSAYGRTGKMFAMEHFGVSPDLTCIGKSMGGGLPLSGIVGRADIIDSVPPGGLGGTFGGNPVACSAALAVLDVIEEDKLLSCDYEIMSELTTFIQKNNSFEAEEGCNDDLAMCLVIYAWLVAQDYFKELTDQDVRKRLYEEQKNQIEQDMAPFGFMDDGMGEDSFVDADGDHWKKADEYGDRSFMWEYR